MKGQDDSFIDVLTNESITVSKNIIEEQAKKVRDNFYEPEIVHRTESSLIDRYIENEHETHSGSAPAYDDLIEISDVSKGTYISNYRYFLEDPYHAYNSGNTCGSVATQLLLSYYNYYVDRRIIPNNYLFDATDENPNTCVDPGLMTRMTLGSKNEYYRSIRNILEPEGNGSTISGIVSTIRTILNGRGLDGAYSITKGGIAGVSLSSSVVTSKIRSNTPVLLSLSSSLGGTKDKMGHFVIGYGYQDYTYSSGEGTYSGYIAHFGWSNEGRTMTGTGIQAWVNSSWCDRYLSLDMTHTHSYTNHVGGEYNEIKCGICGHRKYAYATNILSYDKVAITANENTINGDLRIPDKINGRDVVKIANGVFRNQSISNLVLPSGLLEIGDQAFLGCSEMQTRLPNSITTIGSSAFESCENLDAALPSSLTMLGDSAFESCTALKTVNMPSGVTIIKDATFKFCSALTRVILPSTLTRIEDNAFFATAIKSVDIPSSVTYIGTYAFSLCEMESVDFKSNGNLQEIGVSAFNCCLKLKGGIVIPKSVTKIGDFAFGFCTELELCILPCDVTTLSSRAFEGCSKLTIYTDRSNEFGSGGRPVIYECVLSQAKDYVISFDKSNSNPTNASASNGINNPKRKGYNFDGWYKEEDAGTLYTDIASAPSGTLYAKWTEIACVAEGSLITLADGSQVAVENLTGNERLLVWNMLTGQFDTAPILFIDSESLSSYEVIKLTFSDGTEVRIIDEHAFFDMTLGEYVFLREDAARYIGHYFNKQSGDTWTTVQLTNVTVTVESTTAWSPVTYGHLCYYVNGMLTMPGATEGFINIFDVDTAQMKYDATAMANDIETYGLYTYEEFNALIPLPEFVFNAFNGQYLKVSVGKGLITLSEIADLLQRYSVFFY